jgi:hypothetical protein
VTALDLWRARLRAGFAGQKADRPATWKYDALWRAACYEAEAREAEQRGLVETAACCRADAIAVLAEAERRCAA